MYYIYTVYLCIYVQIDIYPKASKFDWNLVKKDPKVRHLRGSTRYHEVPKFDGPRIF